jgi:DNA-directed RNA polymerase subunit RPC12/RpoP
MQGDAGRPPDCRRRFRLACANCGRRFEVAEAEYRRLSGAVDCPLCGSLDLVLLEDERRGSRRVS